MHTRTAMGMPGSIEHMDELMSLILGDLVKNGVTRVADDLYTGGNTISELLHNWERILQCFEANNLRLSAPKTVICPPSTVILEWVRSNGHIRVSPHKVSTLVTTNPPPTVRGLRSWTGAFKHLKPCLPQYATTAVQQSKARIQLSDNLLQCFSLQR